MKTLAVALLVISLLYSLPAPGQDENVRFASVGVYVDSANPVAAWQFEFADRHGLMQVVGVERGDSAAFERVPYYDREAVRRGMADRIVVADYSLAHRVNLPVGRVRIATIHVMLSGGADADFDVRLITANGPAGERIDAAISLEREYE